MQLQLPSIIHFLPVSSDFHIYTHAFRSLLRVVYALPTVQDTSTHKCRLLHHGYNAVADDSLTGSHLVARILHWLRTDKVEKVEKGQMLWVHTLPYDLLQTKKGDVCNVWFRSV